jgi:hypothetical protein
VDGRLQMPADRYRLATFEQHGAAKGETRRMRDHGLQRGPCRWKIEEFRIGDNLVRALRPTKTCASVLAGNCIPPTAIPINTRRYFKRGRDYPPGIDKRRRLRLGDLKKSQARPFLP